MSLSERFIVPGRYIGKITDSFFASRFFYYPKRGGIGFFVRFSSSFRLLARNLEFYRKTSCKRLEKTKKKRYNEYV